MQSLKRILLRACRPSIVDSEILPSTWFQYAVHKAWGLGSCQSSHEVEKHCSHACAPCNSRPLTDEKDSRPADILLALNLLHGQRDALVHACDDCKATGRAPGPSRLHLRHLLCDICIHSGQLRIAAAKGRCQQDLVYLRALPAADLTLRVLAWALIDRLYPE